MKITVLEITYFALYIRLCQLVTEYPMCDQTSTNMAGCCMLSKGALRCVEITCPAGYYNVTSSSTCSDSETSTEDKEVYVQKEITVTHTGSSTLAPSLRTRTPQSVSGASKDDVSVANQSDSEAASFKLLTSDATRQPKNASQKAPPLASAENSSSSKAQTSRRTSVIPVTPATSSHVFCCQCHVSCLTCSNKGPEHCLTCAQGFVWTSTNTTEGCVKATASSSLHVHLIILCILSVLVLICSLCMIFILFRRRKGKSMNDDFQVANPLMTGIVRDEICEDKEAHANVFTKKPLDPIEPTPSQFMLCLIPHDEEQQYRPSAVRPKYRCDSAMKTNDVFLSRRLVEDVPRRVELLCALGCETLESQSMAEVWKSESVKLSSQLVTTEERNNAAMPSCSFGSIADIHSEPEPVYWEIPDTCVCVDPGGTQSVLDSYLYDDLLRESSRKEYICDGETHFEIMNAAHSCSLGSEKSYGSIISSLFSLIADSDKDIDQLFALSDFCGREKSSSLLSGQSLILSTSEILSKDKSLPSPVICPQWDISEDFSWTGGVLQVESSGVCLKLGEGAVSDVVTIFGAVSTDLTSAYEVLSLPEDEIIVSPVAEYFAGFCFRFEKSVRIVLPHFLSSDLPGDLVRVYEFHSENGRIQCFRLQMMNPEDENPSTTKRTGYFFPESNKEIHVFTDHFSGYVCTACEKACMGYYKPPEVTLQALAKHVLRCNGKREVIVRLDLWDSRFFSPDPQKKRQQAHVSTEDRQMVLVLERKLKSLDDTPDVGNAEIGARLQVSEEQSTFWSHVSSGGVNVCPIEQRMPVKELYPCRNKRPPFSLKWMLRDANPIPPQEEFECFIYVGYIDGQIPARESSFGNDQQTISFMKCPDFLILPIRRAMKLDEDHPDSLKYLEQTAHGCLAEENPSQTSENTSVKNLASLSESTSLDFQTSSVNSSHGCSMLRHERDSGYIREFSDTSSANSVSIQHVQSINSLNLYFTSSTPPARDETLREQVFGAVFGDTQVLQEQDSSERNHNMKYSTPVSDQ